MNSIKSLAIYLFTAAALAFSSCSKERIPTRLEVYRGDHPTLGDTRLKTYREHDGSLHVVINAPAVQNPNCPGMSKRLYDTNGNGEYDSATVPYCPDGTNIIGRERIERSENDPRFDDLEDTVKTAMDARGTGLKQVEARDIPAPSDW